jgi:hypothetical protein
VLYSPLNLVLTKDTPPTSDNIESALQKIGDTKKCSNNEIQQALKDLNRWVNPKSNNRRGFYNEFLELAGISRVLKFLMVPSNMSDMDYVHLVGMLIARCAHGGKKIKIMKIETLSR